MPEDALRNLHEMDRLIHEPARLAVMMILASVEAADFLYLMHEIGLTKGNLSSHLIKLENAGYIEIEKTYQEKRPRTICRLTDTGRAVFETYMKQLEDVMNYNQMRKAK